MKENKAYCVCYNELMVFESRIKAIEFFTIGTYYSEGSEQTRYFNILRDLQFSNIGKDYVNDYVYSIALLDNENNLIERKDIKNKHYLKAIKELEDKNEN